MSIFGKSKQPPEEPLGRRRPPSSDGARPQAFSYYAQRSGSSMNTGRGQTDSGADTARPAIDWHGNRMLFGIGSIFAAAVLLYLLTLAPDPKVVLKTSGGNAYFVQDPAAYQKTAANALSGSLLNRNKLTVDTAKVAKDIKANYPEVARATMDVPLFGQKPVVVIEPYKPSFVLTTGTNAAFLLDENGRALVSASQIGNGGELSVPTLQDKSTLQVRLGAQVVSSGTIRFIQQVLAILEASGVEHGTLSLPAAANQLDVAIKGKPYYVKFNLQGDARLQSGTFLATKQRLEKDRTSPSEYIDVRVPDRAYYK